MSVSDVKELLSAFQKWPSGITIIVVCWLIGWALWGHFAFARIADVNALQAEMLNSQTALQIFRDEWKCDSLNRRLSELYAEKVATERQRDIIQGQRRLMDNRQCDRFVDY